MVHLFRDYYPARTIRVRTTNSQSKQNSARRDAPTDLAARRLRVDDLLVAMRSGAFRRRQNFIDPKLVTTSGHFVGIKTLS
jgi:hypothetical protein